VILVKLYLPDCFVQHIDQLVTERFYPDRSTAVRVALEDLLKEIKARAKN